MNSQRELIGFKSATQKCVLSQLNKLNIYSIANFLLQLAEYVVSAILTSSSTNRKLCHAPWVDL